jgi:hypothetical protein
MCFVVLFFWLWLPSVYYGASGAWQLFVWLFGKLLFITGLSLLGTVLFYFYILLFRNCFILWRAARMVYKVLLFSWHVYRYLDG